MSKARLRELNQAQIPMRTSLDSVFDGLRADANAAINLNEGRASWEMAGGLIRMVPGGSTGSEFAEGNYGRGSLYFVGDVALTLTGGKFLQNARGASLLARSGMIAGTGGFYHTAVEIGGDRYDAWSTGQSYERTWGDDLRSLGSNTVRSAIVGVAIPWAVNRLRVPITKAIPVEAGYEYYYRSMSRADYHKFLETGKVPRTTETFISPTQTFAQSYEGVLVRFQVAPGTSEALRAIGVRAHGAKSAGLFPNLPTVKSGWGRSSALFKPESGQINIGLGTGSALDLFNSSIRGFEILEVVR